MIDVGISGGIGCIGMAVGSAVATGPVGWVGMAICAGCADVTSGIAGW